MTSSSRHHVTMEQQNNNTTAGTEYINTSMVQCRARQAGTIVHVLQVQDIEQYRRNIEDGMGTGTIDTGAGGAGTIHGIQEYRYKESML